MNAPPTHVLALCTGNLCRSPLVELLLGRAFQQRSINAVVTSAGTKAPDQNGCDRKMIKVGDELGFDLRPHRSRQVTRADIDSADLILVMTAGHLEHLSQLAGDDALQRTVLLRTAVWRSNALAGQRLDLAEWLSRLCAAPTMAASDDVKDPIRGPLRGYRHIAADIEALIERLVANWPKR